MRPRMPRTVTVRTPGAVGVDPATGNEARAAPAPTSVVTAAYLAQQSVHLLSAGDERRARQDTTISTFTLLVPPEVALTSGSEVTDEAGVVYKVAGQPLERSGLGRARFRAASLHRISDLQAQP